MQLKEILDTKKYPNIKFRNICLNTLYLKEGDLFIPYGGLNREKYITEAINKKCSLVITDKFYPSEKVIQVKNLNKLIIDIFNRYYDYPLKKLNLIGITGTDGKTTLSSILSDLLACPSIGTNGFKFQNKNYPLTNTTPSIDILYNCFEKSLQANYKNIVMEVSSEAYLTNRIGDLPFTVSIFTNITKEHLDKHKTFANYLECKLKLFRNSRIAILPRDSKYYYQFKDNANISYSYGFKKGSTLQILNYKLYFDKTILTFKYQTKKYKITIPLLGKFNVYNIAAAILTLLTLGYDMDFIQKRLEYLTKVSGRMEIVYNKNFLIVLDYAHTTNATYNVLKFFSKFKKNIITVVGCAGGRYKEKRKEIGKIVLKYSKLVIFTSDDPRFEDPNQIISEMLETKTKKNYIKIIDREEAIRYAISKTKKDGVVLILGKGRDNYMLVEDKKIPYSDYDTVLKILKENNL